MSSKSAPGSNSSAPPSGRAAGRHVVKYEDLKVEFTHRSCEEKQRFMEEVGLGLCKDMMSDTAFMDRMMPRCMERMGQMPDAMRGRMQDWVGGMPGGGKS
jgi:hypothetical protein